MKSFKTIFSAIICFALIGVIAASELLYCAHSTLLSSSHFSKMLEDDKKLDQVAALVYGSLTESALAGENQGVVSKYALDILNKTDQSWVKGQVYINAVGLHKYITAEAAALPTLDFAPLNAAIKASLISEIASQPQTKEKVEKVKTVLAVLDNKYLSAVISFGLSNQLTGMLLELAPIRSTGFDRSTLQEIIRIYLSFSNKNMSIDQASQSIVSQMILEGLELDKLKDYFDTNVFLKKAFGSENPIAAFKTLINRTDTSISLTVKIFFWCLLLLLFINSGLSLTKLLKSALLCAVLGSAVNFLLSALFVNTFASQSLIAFLLKSEGVFDNFLVKLSGILLRDFGLYLALQSVLLAIIAAVTLLLASVAFNKARKTRRTARSFPVWRFNIVLVVILLVFSWWSVLSLTQATKQFQNSINVIKAADIHQQILSGLTEAGGMNFLKYLQKK